MKKLLITMMLLMSPALLTWAQTNLEDDEWGKPIRKLNDVVLPGKGHINVEKLLKNIDLKMDVSQLSLSECRVLRNAFAARQGYAFMAGDLRAIYETTTWYDSLMYVRFDKEMDILDRYYNCHPEEERMSDEEQETYLRKMVPMKFTKAEAEFIKRLREREAYLMQRNFAIEEGEAVNIDNLVNPWQLNNPDERLMSALRKNGFAIVPNNYEQLFHVYERNDYHDFPSFVTTDLYLQLFHIYFDAMLRDVEEKKMYGSIEHFCDQMETEMITRSQQKNKEIIAAAQQLATFFSVARSLISFDSIEKGCNAINSSLPQAWQDMAKHEVAQVINAQNDFSEFLDYRKVMFGYSMFRPRGHYTRTDSLSRYFRTMMWLQTVPFGTDKPQQLKCAALMAHVIGTNPLLKTAYLRMSEPMTYLMGTPDNITILQVYDEIMKLGMPIEKLLKNKKALEQLRKNIEFIGEKQTRIRPKYERTSHCKINLLPQRYMPDAEVLQEMVDYDNTPTHRDTPKGLDVLAAMGNTVAERILIDELNEQERWDAYSQQLEKMKQRMGEVDWQQSIATQWMDALASMTGIGKSKEQTSKLPYFMQTPQWTKKALNAALGSWAELKHDAILYAKQPMGAECGDYGPPAPVVKAYVEPNISFWTKATELADATLSVLKKYGLSTQFAVDMTTQLKEQAEFLLSISKKELSDAKITDEEYYQLEVIGATFENITLDLIRTPDQWLQGWSDVQGADKSVAVVADVYTANADNNPVKSVLYEAVGPASNIYVVVEIDGYLYLTRGAVFSYREFQRALDEPRMTDEEWQQLLRQHRDTGVPSWMKEIIVPLDDDVKDNEYIFYSSGC